MPFSDQEPSVLDLSVLIDPKAAGHREAIAQLDQACRQLGFFYISHHGIGSSSIDQMFAAAKQFFALPGVAKYQLSNCDRIDPTFRGLYLDIGEETLDPENPIVDLKEAFDFFSKQNYFGRWLAQAKPASLADAVQPDWQSAQDEFCATAIDFYEICSQVCLRVLHALEIALHLPDGFFQSRFGESNDLRLNYYPACAPVPQPGQFRFSEHTDYGGITLLFQDVPGLEIRTPSGDWIKAGPSPTAIGVIIGDLMQRWTNDQYHSVWHRVVMPQADTASIPRYSVSFFCEPNASVEIACLESCQPSLPQYLPVRTEDYLVGRVNQAVGA
jgi:isopenicillin N synthase-like dioxygenase